VIRDQLTSIRRGWEYGWPLMTLSPRGPSTFTIRTVELPSLDAQTTRRILAANDPVLHPLIIATEEEARTPEIGRLIDEVALPVARRAIQSLSPEDWIPDVFDIEDIIGAVSLRLVRKLQMVPFFEEQAVARFADYVHMLARHTAYDFIRRRFPARARLRARLRYLLANDDTFEIWTTQRGTVCALRALRRRTPLERDIDIHALDFSADPVHGDLRDVVREILRRAGAPVRVEALLNALSELLKPQDAVQDQSPIDVEAPAAVRFESRQSLAILWAEIQLLRPLQRAALLLNLRAPDGLDAVTLFTVLGIASIHDVANAAGMAPNDLIATFNDLPLDDLTIASRLRITRQQVINLRKAARARLARRFAKRGRSGENIK
jgi:hypothetical protein